MDLTQNDHLKSYGIAFFALKNNINVEWLLNYRGGSFLLDEFSEITEVARVRGVTYEIINPEQALNIFNETFSELNKSGSLVSTPNSLKSF